MFQPLFHYTRNPPLVLRVLLVTATLFGRHGVLLNRTGELSYVELVHCAVCVRLAQEAERNEEHAEVD